MKPIYLDHNATTPVAPRVLDVMLPFLRSEYGNASSNYTLGKYARDAIERARTDVAALISANPDEIIFTSGGTESSNIAIHSAVVNKTSGTIVTTSIEHPATEEPCALFERSGFTVNRAKPDTDGIVSTERIIEAIGDGASLVTIIHAQNEIGTLQPVAEIARAARAKGTLIHTDAAQSVGKIPIDVKALDIDYLTIAGHKLYAPKGIGALYVRRGAPFEPLLRGAGQESGRRAGTENVPYIVGLGEACRLAATRLQDDTLALDSLTVELFERLEKEIPGIEWVGHPDQRLPNTLNVLFPGVSGRKVLEACPRVLASTGSACHADREDASSILLELGISAEKALSAVRLSLGFTTKEADIEDAATALAAAWRSVMRMTKQSA